jgi:hypothetical protein
MHLILGGAALQRCGKSIVLGAALAAEAALSARELVLSSACSAVPPRRSLPFGRLSQFSLPDSSRMG